MKAKKTIKKMQSGGGNTVPPVDKGARAAYKDEYSKVNSRIAVGKPGVMKKGGTVKKKK